ncbi:GPO family capsid scaffolding protein [Enterobacter sp. JGM127]|nr:GPO family capsid scaffolding protein [Enterobacter sp. JGM127]
MSHLMTDWLCVATEGDTVDGRVLERQWLIDAAELYDAKLYAALIWPEHCKDYGNFGEVLEAMYQEGEDGKVRLYVRLRPNQFLLDANRYGQLLFFSVELTPDGNWRNTGRSYLEGLAVTDTPASVGTTRLRFSNRNKIKSGYYGCRISKAGKIEQVNNMKKDWQSWFGIHPKKFEEQPTETEPDAEDKMQVLANALNELEARVSTIEEKLNSTAEDVEAIAEVVDTQEFATLRDNIKDVIKNFSKLDKKVTTLPKRQFGENKDKRFKFL